MIILFVIVLLFTLYYIHSTSNTQYIDITDPNKKELLGLCWDYCMTCDPRCKIGTTWNSDFIREFKEEIILKICNKSNLSMEEVIEILRYNLFSISYDGSELYKLIDKKGKIK